MLHWGYDEHNGREQRAGLGPLRRCPGCRRGGQRGPSGSTSLPLASAPPLPSGELDELKCFAA